MNTYKFRDDFVLAPPTPGLTLVAQLVDDAGAFVEAIAGTYIDWGFGSYSFSADLAINTEGRVVYYQGGHLSTPLARTPVSLVLDSPGVTSIVNAIASGQDGITVVTAESATSLVVSGLTVPVANMANSLIDAILNDGNTKLYKGTARVSSATVVPSSSNNRILLVAPGLPVCATNDTIQLRG